VIGRKISRFVLAVRTYMYIPPYVYIYVCIYELFFPPLEFARLQALPNSNSHPLDES
jgi:hypothetical protein